ncbi:MAG: serine hydroxymethyltransferase [Vampirovibrionales bacterium]
MFHLGHLKQADPEIYALTLDELQRQQEGLEMIASENFTSYAIMEAAGTILTNKYAEGTPYKRYYGGCEKVDGIEAIAIERAKQLFGAYHANVQPHAGAQANMAAFLAAGLKAGDTVMGMDLSNGGHLTHGSPANFSGQYYNIVSYGVDAVTGRLDYEAMEALAVQHQPKLIIVGASAYPRVIDFARFRAIADKVGAILLADIAHIAGLVVGGVHPSPFPHCHLVTTTTHKSLRGPRSGLLMCSDETFAKAIDKAVFPGLQGGPLMHIITAKAVCFKEALSPEFKAYAQAIVDNAQALATGLMKRGIKLTSNGTENHMMVVDLTPQDLSGKEMQHRLDEIGITTNKNTVPNDPRSPFVTSGVRLGTPALTTRGFTPEAMHTLAEIIADCILMPEGCTLANLHDRVKALGHQFPLYPELAETYRPTPVA